MDLNYFRLVSLITDITPRVLRQFLKDQWQRAGYSSFVDLLSREKHRFYHCYQPGRQHPRDTCCCGSNKESYKSMTAAQWELLYEDTGSSAACLYIGKHPCKYQPKAGVQLEQLDISLLSFIIDKLLLGNTSLDNIRKHRNELIHSGTTSICDVEFHRKWVSARGAILQIANTSAAPFPTEIEREIDILETKSLDRTECERLLNIVKHLTDTDKLLQDILSEVTVVKCKVESMEATRESLETNVKVMKTTVHSTETNVKTLQAVVEPMEAKLKSINRKLDENSKTSRHEDIKRRIESTSCKLSWHRNGFYVSLGAAEEAAYNRLLTKHLVTISGRAGSGKTSLGKQLMINYCDQHTGADGTSIYTPVIISKPEDFDNISSEDRLLVFIDDPFGASNVDDKKLKEWEKHFDDFLSYCNEGNTRIIIAVRSYLISEPEETFRKFDLFSKENIIDLSTEHKLTSTERLQILKAYCRKNEVKIIDEEVENVQMSKESSSGPPNMSDMNASSLNNSEEVIIWQRSKESSSGPPKMTETETSHIKTIHMSVLSQISKLDLFQGFPLACYRFFKMQSFFEHGANFFVHAADSLKKEISELETREPLLYFTLSFMLLKGGHVDLDNINRYKLKKLNESLRQKYRRVDIKDCCKSQMNKMYIERDPTTEYFEGGKRKMRYKFAHQTVKEAVLLSLWDRYFELVLMHSHHGIIKEFVRPSGYNPEPEEICVKVPKEHPEYNRLLAERIIRIRSSTFFIRFYKGIYDASFVEVLLDVMERAETHYDLPPGYEKEIYLSMAITELLREPDFDNLFHFLKALCTRYTHNGHKCVTPETKQNVFESPHHSETKKKLIGFIEFLTFLNECLKNGRVDFAEQLIDSDDIDPVYTYTYDDIDPYSDMDVNEKIFTQLLLCHAADSGLQHLVIFCLKKNGPIEKQEHLRQLLDKCIKKDLADVFEILILNNKHGRRENELSLSSVYSTQFNIGREMAKYFIQGNIDISLTAMDGNNLLHICSKHGFKTDVLRILGTHPGVINVQNEDGQTAICLAAMHGNQDIVKELLRSGMSTIDITLRDRSGDNLLHHCSKSGWTNEVSTILETHPEIVNVQNKDGQTAICLAAMHGKQDTVKELLQHWKSIIEITLSHKCGCNLLHHCSERGMKTEVSMILETHPEIINVQNCFRETAIYLAAKHKKMDTVKELMQYGVDISMQSKDGNTFLHYCATYDWEDIVQQFVTNTMLLDKKNNRGFSPVHIAVMCCSQKVVKTLIEAGVNLQHEKYSSIALAVLGDVCSPRSYGLDQSTTKPRNGDIINHVEYMIRHNDSIVKSLCEPLGDNHYTVIQYYILENVRNDLYSRYPSFLSHVISRYPRAVHARNEKVLLPTCLHLAAYMGNYKLFCLLYDAGVRIAVGDPSIMSTLELGNMNAGMCWNSWQEVSDDDDVLKTFDLELCAEFGPLHRYEKIQQFYDEMEHRR